MKKLKPGTILLFIVLAVFGMLFASDDEEDNESSGTMTTAVFVDSEELTMTPTNTEIPSSATQLPVESTEFPPTAIREVITPTSYSNDTSTDLTSDVQLVPEKTYYVIASANLRTCARIDSNCPVRINLGANSNITVTGTTTGDTFQGSNLWYQAEVNGETLYLHSALVSESRQGSSVENPSGASDSSSSGGSNTSTRRPANCDEAVEMGLSAEEAAQWSHLDRDNDGVACYGE